jgi:hypothetical protein
MSQTVDWGWKLREAVERLKTQFEQIGRKTGYPFLGIVYPPEAEAAALKEWHTIAESLRPEFDIRTIDVLAVTRAVVGELGGESVVEALANPMPGANPEAELGNMWVTALAARVKKCATEPPPKGKVVIVLENVAALYPAAGPRDLMQKLWDQEQSFLRGPVVIVVLIPGTLVERKVYSFVNERDELMYRGDIL